MIEDVTFPSITSIFKFGKLNEGVYLIDGAKSNNHVFAIYNSAEEELFCENNITQIKFNNLRQCPTINFARSAKILMYDDKILTIIGGFFDENGQ